MFEVVVVSAGFWFVALFHSLRIYYREFCIGFRFQNEAFLASSNLIVLTQNLNWNLRFPY